MAACLLKFAGVSCVLGLAAATISDAEGLVQTSVREVRQAALTAELPNATNTSDAAVKTTTNSSFPGNCTAEDFATMEKMGGGHKGTSLPATAAACGRSSYELFHGITDVKFRNCMKPKTGLNMQCTD